MKRAWEQFALIIFGSMVGVFAFGVYYNMSLDTILLRTLIVGVALFAIFSLVHTWLTMVFTGSRRKPKSSRADTDSSKAEDQSVVSSSRSGVLAEAQRVAEDSAEDGQSSVGTPDTTP